MNDFLLVYTILCTSSILLAVIISITIHLYKRRKEKGFVTRYRIEEYIYKIDRNINGDVMKIYNYYVVCRDTSPWISWYLDFRIKDNVFHVIQYHSREYAEHFFSKDKAENRVKDMLINPDKYILDE